MTHKRSVMPSLSEFRSRQTMDDRTTTAQGNVGRRTVKNTASGVIPLSRSKRAMHRPSQCMHSLLIDGETAECSPRASKGDSNDQIESDARIRVRSFGRIGSSGQPNPLQNGGQKVSINLDSDSRLLLEFAPYQAVREVTSMQWDCRALSVD